MRRLATVLVLILAQDPVLRDFETGAGHFVFSNDGKEVCVAGAGVWSIETGERGTQYAGGWDRIAVNKNGLALLGNMNELVLRGRGTADPAKPVAGHARGSAILALSAAPDGTFIVCAADYLGRVDATGKLTKLMDLKQGHRAAVSVDAKRTVTGDGKGGLRIWDNKTGKLVRAIPLPETTGPANLTSVCWSPDAKMIAAGYGDGSIRLWADSGALVKALSGHCAPAVSVEFSPDGKRLLSCAADAAESGVAEIRDGTVRIWDVDKGTVISGFSRAVGGGTVAFHPDGKRIAYSGHRLVICLPEHGRTFRQLPPATGILRRMALSADGRRLVAASGKDVYQWDLESSTLLKGSLPHDRDVRATACTPDGLKIATVTDAGVLRIWDASTRTLLATAEDLGAVDHLSFSPNGQRLLTVSTGRHVRVIVTDSAAELWRLKGDHGSAFAAWCRRGDAVMLGNHKGIFFVDALDGKTIPKPFEKSDRAGFGGRPLCWGEWHAGYWTFDAEGTLATFDAATGEGLQAVSLTKKIDSSAAGSMSLDGKRLLVAMDSKVHALCELESLKELDRVPHYGEMLLLPGGRQIVQAHNPIWIWETRP